MIPQVGQLSAPFIVQTRSVTRDSFEQPIETWTDAGYVWAKVETRGGFGKGEFEDTLQGMERKVAVIDGQRTSLTGSDGTDIAWSVKDTRLKNANGGLDAAQIYNVTEISDAGLHHHRIELTLEEVTK